MLRKSILMVFIIPALVFSMTPFFNGFNTSSVLLPPCVETGVAGFSENPSVLDNKGYAYSLSYNMFYNDIQALSLTGKVYNASAFSVGAGFQFIDYGSFYDGINNLKITDKELLAGVSFHKLPVKAGVALKYENESFLGENFHKLAFDLGMNKRIALSEGSFFFGLAGENILEISSGILFAPDISVSAGILKNIANVPVVIYNEFQGKSLFAVYSDIIGISAELHKSLKLFLSNKFSKDNLFDVSAGMQYIIHSKSRIIAVSYTVSGINSGIINNGFNISLQ